MKHYFIFAIFVLLTWSCSSSTPILNTEPIGEAAKLNEKYQILARVGTVPVELDTREPIIRYSLKPKNKRPIFLIIVSPKSVKGEIKVPFFNKTDNKSNNQETGLNYSESTVEYNEYIDLMLRAHRHILRGEFDDAAYALEKARTQYDESYASLILQGIIALSKNDLYTAAKHFKTAERLFPQQDIASLTGGNKTP